MGVEARCGAGDLIVLCGEALELMSAGRFGAAPHRRTKWVFIQFVGDKMGMVQRGQANAAESTFKELLRPFNLSMTAHHVSEPSSQPASYVVIRC